jgi:hypothetical protein
LIVFQTHDADIQLDEPKVHFYMGKINVADIVKFLEPFALSEKTYLHSTNKDDLLKKEKSEIRLVTNENFRDVISAAYSRKIIISFTKDGEFPSELSSFIKLTRYIKFKAYLVVFFIL